MTGGEFPAVLALEVFDDGDGAALYAGGQFTAAGGVPANRIARWDGTSWSALSTGLEGSTAPAVRALTAFDDGTGPALYVGGTFHIAGGRVSGYWARWGRLWGDLTGDGLVTADDWTALADCLVGPSVAPPVGCACADLERDDDGDLADFARFQRIFGTY